jgi:hypothetical protein
VEIMRLVFVTDERPTAVGTDDACNDGLASPAALNGYVL